MTTGNRTAKLTLDLLAAVESYDTKAVLRSLRRILPNQGRRVLVSLAAIALVSLKQRHGNDWPNHVTPALEAYAETYAEEAPAANLTETNDLTDTTPQTA